MVDLDTGMGVLVRSKGGGTPEIRQAWDWRKAVRRGRRKRRGVQQRSRTVAEDHGEIGGDDGGGTFGEPPRPLGGVC